LTLENAEVNALLVGFRTVLSQAFFGDIPMVRQSTLPDFRYRFRTCPDTTLILAGSAVPLAGTVGLWAKEIRTVAVGPKCRIEDQWRVGLVL